MDEQLWSRVLGDRRVLKHNAYKFNFSKSQLLSLLFSLPRSTVLASLTVICWAVGTWNALSSFSGKAFKSTTKQICTWATPSGTDGVMWRRGAEDLRVVSEPSPFARFHFGKIGYWSRKANSWPIFPYVRRLIGRSSWSSSRAQAGSGTVAYVGL